MNARLELLFANTPYGIISALIAYGLLVSLCWHTAREPVLLWLLAQVLVLALRIISYRQFKDNTQRAKRASLTWYYIALGQFSLIGILWGLVPFIFLDFSSLINISAINLLLMGVVIGSVATGTIFFSLWLMYALPFVLAMSLAYFFSPIDEYNFLGWWYLVTLFILSALARKTSQMVGQLNILQLQQTQLANKLQIEKENAEKANISKSKFLASASHDLRQPVQAFTIIIETLQMQPLSNVAESLVDKLALCMNGLRSLFNGLLDISSLDAGTVEVSSSHIDIAVFCRELAETYKEQAEAKQIKLNVLVESEIVYTDPFLLKRILSNLLTNAILYTDKGNICLTARKDINTVIVSVSDTGKGIAETDKEKIFDEFHQLHNPERDRNKGLGLGLAICKRLANLLETDIQVQSTVNCGSSFSLQLPLGEKEFCQTFAQPMIKSDTVLHGNILLIDDEQDILDVMPALLLEWGAENIETASDEKEAIALVKQGFLPDVIISDFRLRENRTSLKALDAINKALGKQIPALLITGETDPESLAQIHEAALPVLHKPIIPSELKESLVFLLGAADVIN